MNQCYICVSVQFRFSASTGAGGIYIIFCLIDALKSIISDCKQGFYNSTTNCFSRCGHCKDNVTCEKESGYCSNGCGPYFKDPYCQGTRYSDVINFIATEYFLTLGRCHFTAGIVWLPFTPTWRFDSDAKYTLEE